MLRSTWLESEIEFSRVAMMSRRAMSAGATGEASGIFRQPYNAPTTLSCSITQPRRVTGSLLFLGRLQVSGSGLFQDGQRQVRAMRIWCASGRHEGVAPLQIAIRLRQSRRGRPCHTINLALEIGNAIPHQLNGDGKNQKAEDFIDGSDGARPKPTHERTAQPKEKQHGECHSRNPYDHSEI